MSAARSLPAIATRGRSFAVARLTHATPDAEIRIAPARWTALAEAEKAARAIDWRLAPTVILVDRQA